MRTLLIEDDSFLSKAVTLMLAPAGIVVDNAPLGAEGIDLASTYDYDVILLDLTLPDLRGTEVLRRLRLSKVNTPVIILSGATDVEAKVQALSSGADDYVTKPFDKGELVARIQAVVRRSQGHAQSVIKTGPITVNLSSRRVDVDGVVVHLTNKEYQLMELLCLRKGTTLTKDMVLNHLYGGMDEPEQKIVDVFICKLRKKLSGATKGDHHIETVWGRGYALRDAGSDTQALPMAA